MVPIAWVRVEAPRTLELEGKDFAGCSYPVRGTEASRWHGNIRERSVDRD